MIAMSSPQKPAILIVHGGFTLPDSWVECMDALAQAGFTTRCPRLPTCGDVRPPKATLQDDIDAVRDTALELAEARHSIIALAHSWGGLVMSEAISKDLYAEQFISGEPKGRGVVHLIYLSAWMLLPGRSPVDAYETAEHPSKMELGFNEDNTAWVKNPAECLYNDVEVERASGLAKKHVTFNWAEVAMPASGTPWKDIPTTFVYCAKDVACDPVLQKAMVTDANEISGAAIKTDSCNAGHSPFLSMPLEVVRVVKKVWTSLQEK